MILAASPSSPCCPCGDPQCRDGLRFEAWQRIVDYLRDEHELEESVAERVANHALSELDRLLSTRAVGQMH